MLSPHASPCFLSRETENYTKQKQKIMQIKHLHHKNDSVLKRFKHIKKVVKDIIIIMTTLNMQIFRVCPLFNFRLQSNT